MSEAGSLLAAQLSAEAEAWAAPCDISSLESVDSDDLPLIDIGAYLSDPEAALPGVARQLRDCCESVGFLMLANHGLDAEIDRGVRATMQLRQLPEEHKRALVMGSPHLAPGVGLLQEGNRVLPARALPNFNESFVVKRELGPRNVTLDDAPWPPSVEGFDGQEFEAAARALAEAYERLSLRLLPAFAVALGLPPEHFAGSARAPVYRMRLASYAPTPSGHFGINPHVDTSFFTLLASTDLQGLVLFGKRKKAWLRASNAVHLNGVPVARPLVVNTGQLLAQLTNDAWLPTRHFAVNAEGEDLRISLPFFFNLDATAPIGVLPHFASPEKPAKYPTVSYLDSQAIVQGE